MTQATSRTIVQALADASALGMDRLDAQLLLLHALGRSGDERGWLLAHDTDAVAPEVADAFSRACVRRVAGEPVAYLLGEKEFHGLMLKVDSRVLVPRPDTETLVDWAIECLTGHREARVMDLGTGSGAIALALQASRPDLQIHAVDASADALDVARANGERLSLPVRFAVGNWLEGAGTQYTLIVSNPPYIAERDPHLPALAHEPLSALASGPDGLDDIRTIIDSAPAHLADGGWLLLEHGYDQSSAVKTLLSKAGFDEVQSRTDLAGIERCSGGKWHAVK
ncbi:peptide chain release factor N(5)-glutamine methyltransferase [Variovorax sp. J22R133]|uniref:peptide chain release factor N(5)-glutamine methyltransferase n=1 Tax=Variovorax brevis TaxID=3053503 RepID=UPI002575A3A7|nr:peptide chain release factor N(5)-glutamine methyltransferase [Variovorax sp. J22R133]MDM0112957.1 peptide chain release factor N(5)-glutamine methyltransferase [Variovorax sp. J22R133]